MDDRFPIGKFIEQPFSPEQKEEWLFSVSELPARLESSVLNLDEAQLKTPYRSGGWTVQQVVHHVADSHMNAYIRFKLGLSENRPTIKPYSQDDWANMADVDLPVNISLTLLHALHRRWVELLKKMDDEAFSRTIFHPEQEREMSLWYLLGNYAWHGQHHTAHINRLRSLKGW